MKPKHLSYKRAIETCLCHQHLIGQPFSPEQTTGSKIRRVLIAPYNRILRWQFLAEVFAGADPEKALGICRDGKYEVVLLSEEFSPDQEQHRPKTLAGYMLEKAGAAPVRSTTGYPQPASGSRHLAIGDTGNSYIPRGISP